MKTLHLLVILLLTISSIGLTKQLAYAQNENPPVIITQVELGSSLMLVPDNQTCTFPPDPKLTNNCLIGLVPDHKVACSYFLGSETCEPLHQTSTGTNQSCIEGYPLGRAPQWFDMYNTLGTIVDLKNFTVSDKLNYQPYGNYGPFPNIVELGPYEKCTFPWLPNDQALAIGLNNMSMSISYNYNAKYYNASTPSLSDTHNDTRTWQFDGNKWIFAQENTVMPQETLTSTSLPTITVSTNLQNYTTGDKIIISGHIANPNGKLPLVIKIFDPRHQQSLSKLFPLWSNESYAWTVPPASFYFSGNYTVLAQYDQDYVTTNFFLNYDIDQYLQTLSPLQQLKMFPATLTQDVHCRPGLQLILKAEDYSPACVHPLTATKLVMWGWALGTTHPEPFIKNMSIVGLQQSYVAGQQINATVIYSGYYWYTEPEVKIFDANGTQVWFNCPFCYARTEPVSVPSLGIFTYHVIEYGTRTLPMINKADSYTMVASLDNKTASAKFDVIPVPSIQQNNTGTVNIGNQTFYFTTLNDTLSSYHGVGAIPFTFNDVNFTLFPSVFSAGPPGSCGDTNFGSEVKFTDGTYERLSVHIPGQPCSENYTEIVLSNHKNPQAGLEDYYGKIRLLVSEENQTSSVEPTACDTPYNPKSGYQSPLYHNGTRISTGYTPVFYMPLNSTGKLCVHYNNWNQPTQVGIRIFEANDLTQDAKTITISGSHTVPLGNSSTVYTINSGNKAGFYGLSFVCGGMPFAVGYDNHSRIVSSDFPWLKETFMCPAITFNSDITGTSGIGTYYIAETTREQIGYNITGISVSSTHPSPTSQNVTFTLNVRTYDTGAKLWFDFKDSNAIKFNGDPQLYEESNPCNWTFNNDRSVDNAQWLKLVGGFRVTDNPVTIPSYSNGTYTFSIFAKNLDYGWYGLSPIIFGESPNSNIPLQNLGGSSVASYYPITMGLDSNLDPSGVCDR